MSCFNPSNCKALEGKPKMFFLQLDNSEFLSGSLVSDNPLPDEADFLYVNSLVAKASPYGTLFVRTLTDVLAERSQQHDLMTMLHTVQEVMSDTAPIRSGERQLPQIVSFLRMRSDLCDPQLPLLYLVFLVFCDLSLRLQCIGHYI